MRTILAVLLVIISTKASSGFWDNRQDWEKSTKMAQLGYAPGVFDEMTLTMHYDTPEVAATKNEFRECVMKMQLNVGALRDIIDNHYTDLANWQDPPKIALRIGLMKVCKIGAYK